MSVDDVKASPGRRNTARSAGRPGRYADDAAVASPGRSKVRTVQQVEPGGGADDESQTSNSCEGRLRAPGGLRFFLNFLLSLECVRI